MSHTSFINSICVFIALTFLCSSAAAQSTAVFFDDRDSFEKAAEVRRTIDFESVAPAKGFGKYAPDAGLKVDGIAFLTSGGARFGSGTIYVPSADYTALNPGMAMLRGAHLSWSVPNQPGNAHLELSFPTGLKAFGADLWALQPVVSPIEITITTRNGQTHVRTITTRKRPESTFAGFISESEIASVRFTLAKGQSTFLMDNLAYGGVARGADLTALAGKNSSNLSSGIENERPKVLSQPIETGRPGSPSSRNESLRPDRPLSQAEPTPPAKARPSSTPSSNMPATGTIAYVRGSNEIRTISPDGSNDRRLWTHPDAHEGLGINELAWSRDGSELAFSSGHESAASFYHADIFSIKPNGAGLRRITNGPDRADFSKYGKGTVTVTIRNEQPIYQTSKASAGIFFVYVVGADLPQSLVLPPGSSRTLTFKNVADFGDHAQGIVATYGATRWIIPGIDVKAGKVVKAPDFGISGNGLEMFGAFHPAWKHDASRISYRNGACIVSSISSKGSIGHTYDPVFKGENTPAPCAYDWGPTADTSDHLLYSVMTDDDIVIYRLKGIGSQHPGEKLVTISKENLQWLNDIRWLPDGSGFLYSASELAYGHANIFKYDLSTRQTTQVTNFDETFVKGFTISPDGNWIVFERTQKFIDHNADLWIIGMDGKGLRLLTSKAKNPSWGR